MKEKVQNVLVIFQSKLILLDNQCFIHTSSCLLIHDTHGDLEQLCANRSSIH